MGLVLNRSGSALVVAREAADEGGLQHALARLDPNLILIRDLDEATGATLYKVMYWVADDRPAQWVCDWRDPPGSHDGPPAQLSSGLLDLVESQRRDRPGGYDASKAADEANARLVARRRKDAHDLVDAVADEHRARIDRASVGIRVTRDLP